MQNENIACDLIIFGAKGDLACRKLLPALYQLEKKNKLHSDMRIIGVGRANWDKIIYIKTVYQSLQQFMNETIIDNIWKKLSSRLEFCNLDVTNITHFKKLKIIVSAKSKSIIINYLAMPPSTYKKICQGLGSIDLNLDPNRIVVEKPLGSSLQSSQEINDTMSEYFKESQIFRIDHYLGKETILNLLAFRFSNSLFYHNWNNKFIDHVQITVSEEIGVEGRLNYFNKTGQIRDMLQNHLLQILTMITMTLPKDSCANSIRDEKVKILSALRPFKIADKNKILTLGQYTSGILNSKRVPSYLEEIGPNAISTTETFVSMRVNIDNSQWFGVPFFLRTGKRLFKKCSTIIIFFKKLPNNLFKKDHRSLPKNKLIIYLQPNEGISLKILNKKPSLDPEYQLDEINLNFHYSKQFIKLELSDAYEKLLLECIRGTQSLFVRRDEVELAWKWVDSILIYLKTSTQLPNLYKSGTWGPEMSTIMINNNGYQWNNEL